MRILVVGYGSMGVRHARNASELGHEVGICDRDDLRAHQSPYRAFEAIDMGIAWADQIIVSTPTSSHSEILQMVGDKRVLVEKPLGVSVADVAFLADSAPVSVAYNWRCHPHIQQIRQYDLKPRAASFMIYCDKSSWPGEEYGDMLLEASHEIDLALWILGPATVVSAESPHPDEWYLHLHHRETGTDSAIELNGRSKSYARGIALCRTSRANPNILWDAGYAANGWTSRISIDRTHLKAQATPDQMYRETMRRFLLSGESLCTLSEGRAVLGICDDARRLANCRGL